MDSLVVYPFFRQRGLLVLVKLMGNFPATAVFQEGNIRMQIRICSVDTSNFWSFGIRFHPISLSYKCLGFTTPLGNSQRDGEGEIEHSRPISSNNFPLGHDVPVASCLWFFRGVDFSAASFTGTLYSQLGRVLLHWIEDRSLIICKLHVPNIYKWLGCLMTPVTEKDCWGQDSISVVTVGFCCWYLKPVGRVLESRYDVPFCFTWLPPWKLTYLKIDG